MTVRLAVLGADVSHSLSPFLHESAARTLGHDLRYEAESCPDEASFLAAVFRRRAEGALGLNVTAPYKRAAFLRCEGLGVEATEIGAVNTLSWRSDDTLFGDNTDGPGLLDLFGRLAPEVSAEVTILGGGGVARAALWAAKRFGARRVTVLVRDPARMSESGGQFAIVQPFGDAKITAGLVISTLPPTTLATSLALSVLPSPSPDAFLLDLAYGGFGRETELVRCAREAGHEAADGRSLLVAQAARSYQLWMGGELSAIETAMRDALKARDPDSCLL